MKSSKNLTALIKLITQRSPELSVVTTQRNMRIHSWHKNNDALLNFRTNALWT